MADRQYVWQWLCRGCDVIESIGPISFATDDTVDFLGRRDVEAPPASPEVVKRYTTMAFYAHIDWHGCPTPLFSPPRAILIPDPGELDDTSVLPAEIVSG